MSLAPRPVGWQRDRVQTSLSSVLDTGPGASVILCTGDRYDSNLVDPASSHLLASKIKPCTWGSALASHGSPEVVMSLVRGDNCFRRWLAAGMY